MNPDCKLDTIERLLFFLVVMYYVLKHKYVLKVFSRNI